MGERVPALSSKQLIRSLVRLGFVIKPGGKGSHTKLEDLRTRKSIVIPKNEHLGLGLRTRIIKNLEAMGISQRDIYR